MTNPLRTTLLVLLTLAISTAGGALATFLHLPAGWLMGGAVAVTIAAMAGVPLAFPTWLRDIVFLLIGMSMGATVAPDSLSLIWQWPVSLAGLAIELVLIIGLTGWMLNRLFGLDKGTAYLSSFPGHLSFIMGIASAGVGDPRRIAIIQIIRILVLTVALPVGALLVGLEQPSASAGASVIMDPLTLVLLAAGCAVGGAIFVLLKVPAGFVLGAMATATAAKLGGLYDTALPEPLVLVTFIGIGALLGTRFVGITRAEFVQAAKGGLAATVLTVAITTIVAFGVYMLIDMPYAQIWIGLAPGALEGMGALGIALGFDTAFIAAHHVIRLLLLSFAIPAVTIWIRRQTQHSEDALAK
jgi:membrane AbrB-like protein